MPSAASRWIPDLAAVYAVWTVLALAAVLAFGVVRWAWVQAGETVEKMK